MISLDRLNERMAAKGLNPFSAARVAGLGADYVRDIMRGKVKEPSSMRLRALAEVLDCSPDYLMGASDIVGSDAERGGVSIIGIRELPVKHHLRPGYYDQRDDPPTNRFYSVPCLTTDGVEWLERLQGESAIEYLPDGALLHVVPASKNIRSGDLVVIERIRSEGGLVQRTAREVHFTPDGVYFNPRYTFVSREISVDDALSGDNPERTRIVGRVLRAYLLFDDPDHAFRSRGEPRFRS